MGLLNDILGELFDTSLMYCKDCERKFKAKRGSLLGDDHLVVYSNCVYCKGTNTFQIKSRISSAKKI